MWDYRELDTFASFWSKIPSKRLLILPDLRLAAFGKFAIKRSHFSFRFCPVRTFFSTGADFSGVSLQTRAHTHIKHTSLEVIYGL
jgi:hypothetical protein